MSEPSSPSQSFDFFSIWDLVCYPNNIILLSNQGTHVPPALIYHREVTLRFCFFIFFFPHQRSYYRKSWTGLWYHCCRRFVSHRRRHLLGFSFTFSHISIILIEDPTCYFYHMDFIYYCDNLNSLLIMRSFLFTLKMINREIISFYIKNEGDMNGLGFLSPLSPSKLQKK